MTDPEPVGDRERAVNSMVTPAPRIPPGLDTPGLVIDLDVVSRNVRLLQSALDDRGVPLRPHAKTHKSVAIARLQLAAGAAGITVGTLGEAEVMADGGIDDVFIAYPVWAAGPKAERLRALHERSGLRLSVGIDSAAGAVRLATAVPGSDHPLAVLVEVDSGGRRTGPASPRAVVEVAQAARDAGLAVRGVFTHGGHSYRDPSAAAGAAADEVRALTDSAAALEANGFAVATISAGSTPTGLLSARGRVNEIRAGTYVLGDRQQLVLGASPPDGLGAYVAATVVSVHDDGRIVLDAGAKALTKDRADFLAGYGLLPAYPDLVIDRLYDYHGVASVRPGAVAPRLGEVVAIVPNHVCPVVDLFDEFTVVRSGTAPERWPVDARGRSA